MEEIIITDIQMMVLHVITNAKKVAFSPEAVQAMLQIKPNFENTKKELTYHIVVGQTTEEYLFDIHVTYQFHINTLDYIEEHVIKKAMSVLETRIEELLSFVTVESGFLEEDKQKQE